MVGCRVWWNSVLWVFRGRRIFVFGVVVLGGSFFKIVVFYVVFFEIFYY